MDVKLILGCVEFAASKHAIAKLSNGRYAVGHLYLGKRIALNEQFDCLDSAFDHWYATLPIAAVADKKAA